MSARRARAGDSESFARATEQGEEEARQGQSGLRPVALYVLFAAASVATRLPFLRAEFLNVDEAAHLLGSWELFRGGELYVDFADNKPPLVYVFYATAQLLFGRGILSVRLLGTVALVPLVALAASAFFGHGRRGVAAAFAFLLASAALLASDAHAVHCEHVALLPLAWGIVLLRSPAALTSSRRLFGAGLLVGLATLAKQPAATALGAIATATLLASLRARPRARPRREALTALAKLWAALGAGFALPLAVTAALFASRGTLGSAFFWVWHYNLLHIDNPMPLADKAARLAKMGALVVPSAGPLVIAAVLARRGPPCGHRRRLPVLVAVFTLVPAFLGLRLFGHYFVPFLFALALAAGPFLGARRPLRLRGPLVAFGVVAVATFSVVGRVVHAPDRPISDVSRPVYERIGEVVQSDGRACPGPLFVWGYAPTIYAYAGGQPASRFVVPIDTLTGYLAGNEASVEGRVETRGRIDAAHWDALMADLERRPPAHFVDTAPADLNQWGRFSLDRFPPLQELVREHYHPLATVDGAVIYRRNECAAAVTAAH